LRSKRDGLIAGRLSFLILSLALFPFFQLVLLHLFVEEQFQIVKGLLHGIVFFWEEILTLRAFPYAIFGFSCSVVSILVNLEATEGTNTAKEIITSSIQTG